jgi:hypothetical protein
MISVGSISTRAVAEPIINQLRMMGIVTAMPAPYYYRVYVVTNTPITIHDPCVLFLFTGAAVFRAVAITSIFISGPSISPVVTGIFIPRTALSIRVLSILPDLTVNPGALSIMPEITGQTLPSAATQDKLHTTIIGKILAAALVILTSMDITIAKVPVQSSKLMESISTIVSANTCRIPITKGSLYVIIMLCKVCIKIAPFMS